jgi:hypothetical protein
MSPDPDAIEGELHIRPMVDLVFRAILGDPHHPERRSQHTAEKQVARGRPYSDIRGVETFWLLDENLFPRRPHSWSGFHLYAPWPRLDMRAPLAPTVFELQRWRKHRDPLVQARLQGGLDFFTKADHRDAVPAHLSTSALEDGMKVLRLFGIWGSLPLPRPDSSKGGKCRLWGWPTPKGQAPAQRGLRHQKGTGDRPGRSPWSQAPISSAILRPISAGLRTMWKPAASMAANLSSARP